MSCLRGVLRSDDVPLQPKPEQALMMLRVQLFTALQQLKDEHLEEFKQLLLEVQGCYSITE